MGDSTQFQIDIDVPRGGTVAAADAVARLSVQLEAAGAASTAASDAVKAGEAAYRQAESAAARAAAAVEKIGLKADEQRGKLAAALEIGDIAGADRAAASLDRLTQRQAEAVSKSNAAKAALDRETASLEQLDLAAEKAQAAEKELTKAHDAAKASQKADDAAAARVGNVNELAESFGKLGGPAGLAGQKVFGLATGLKKLGASAGAAGPYIAIAVAVIAIATAAITATIAVTAWAVSLSDAANTQSRLYQGMVQSVKGGEALEASVNSLASRVPLTNDKLRSMAGELAKTGLRGKELEDALESAAVKASEAQFGPEWAKQVNSLDKLNERFKNHLTGLFRLKTDDLQAGLGRLVSLFDETSVTGKAIKVVFDSLMQPLIDGLTGLVPVIVKTFIQFEIYAMKALIAIKPYGSTIAAAAKALAVLGAVILGVVAVALGIVIGAAALFLTRVVLVWSAIISWGESMIATGKAVWSFGESIMSGAGGALDWLMGKVTEVTDWLGSLSLSQIGTDLIAGLAQGLLGGGPAVLEAISGVVGGAIDSAKKLLGIASPSKVFAEIGANTAAGMQEGVDSGQADVQGSIDALVAPPAVSPISNIGGSTSTSGHTFTGNIILQTAKGGKDAMDQFLAFLEGDADALGTAVPG